MNVRSFQLFFWFSVLSKITRVTVPFAGVQPLRMGPACCSEANTTNYNHNVYIIRKVIVCVCLIKRERERENQRGILPIILLKFVSHELRMCFGTLHIIFLD